MQHMGNMFIFKVWSKCLQEVFGRFQCKIHFYYFDTSIKGWNISFREKHKSKCDSPPLLPVKAVNLKLCRLDVFHLNCCFDRKKNCCVVTSGLSYNIILISLGGLEGVLGVWATMFLVSNHPGDDPSQARVMMMMMLLFVGEPELKTKAGFSTNRQDLKPWVRAFCL